jgi:hypothetical protein
MKDIIELFRKPSAQTLAQRELEEAQRQLLEAQSAAEYAANLARYHTERIRRLKSYIQTEAQL